MAVTSRTITHKFTNADGTPGSGSVTFRLTKRITNGAQTYGPGTITATLDNSGNLSQSLLANDDTGTFPVDSQWLATFRVLGWDVEEFAITVPSAGSGAVDLGTLLPTVTPVG